MAIVYKYVTVLSIFRKKNLTGSGLNACRSPNRSASTPLSPSRPPFPISRGRRLVNAAVNMQKCLNLESNISRDLYPENPHPHLPLPPWIYASQTPERQGPVIPSTLLKNKSLATICVLYIVSLY